MKNKKGFEFGFAWLFAIIVGAAVIFFAIYATMNLIKTERRVKETELGKEIGIILGPIETNLEDARKAKISFPVETRLINECKEQGNFGRQNIRTATKSKVGDEWGFPGEPSSFFNKYIFSAGSVQGKEMVVFSKPFDYPFKIASLIFIWSFDDEYCFVNPPRDVEEEIGDLELTGVKIEGEVGACEEESKKVCFGFSDRECDVEVSLTSRSVKKDRQTLYYSDEFGDALLYGAIFAGPGIYECQVKRLMKRTSELALLFLSETEYLSVNGCSSNLEGGLDIFANQTASFDSSFDFKKSDDIAKELGRRNDVLSCKLW